jgi:hypothetical protein
MSDDDNDVDIESDVSVCEWKIWFFHNFAWFMFMMDQIFRMEMTLAQMVNHVRLEINISLR